MIRNAKDIAETLAAIRRAFGDGPDMTRAKWAARHSFNYTQYANWETGARRIPIEAADVLCDRYGLTLDFVYRDRRDGLSAAAMKALAEHLDR
ncbi:hypothetical protein AB2B41_10420 [Marimonas sp. MJW-29]|uniref:HTH cro/C1-type domain-containing protein n=1 Tax=Sulfitobacter sediminis TaxID=3234186 RepID=A0ABV3RMA8_9RHOB